MTKGLKSKFYFKKENMGAIVTVAVAIAVIVLVLGTAPDLKATAVVPEPGETQTTTQPETTTQPVTQEQKTDSDISVTQPNTTQPQTTTKKSTQGQGEIGKSANKYILVKGTAAMEMYDINRSKLEAYADTINRFAAKAPNVKTFVMLVPTSIEFYGPESYRTGSKSQRQGINIAYDRLGGGITKVDVWSELNKKTNDYIYFRTDHHWTARGAYCAYTALGKVVGFTPTPLESYSLGKINGFVGSMYRYTQNDIIKNNPDYVEYFYNQTTAHAKVFNSVSMTDGRDIRIIYPEIKDDNKYMAFVQGDHPLVKIMTENKNGQKIAVIKESYGNALVPFLIENYEEVYVIDPRKIDMKLDAFAKGQGINNVLFINYTQAPSSPVYIEALSKIIG